MMISREANKFFFEEYNSKVNIAVYSALRVKRKAKGYAKGRVGR